MSEKHLSRRHLLAGAAGVASILAAPAFIRSSYAADNFKLGTFFSLSGPASLFGPTQTACAALAVDNVNAKNGILKKQVEIISGDGGLPPADAAKIAVRMMLRDKVDAIVGSHDSAVRQAIVGALKGKIPYIYTPLYEGGECAPNTYVTADTPRQQIEPSLNYLDDKFKTKKIYLIGNDYVWPQKSNEYAKRHIAELGGEIVGEEYAPLGPGNKFDDAVTRIKAAAPDLVLITLVGGDNINFNRTFAGFGLDKSIKRLSLLCEELTLGGIGAENSSGLYSCMSYFTTVNTRQNKKFQAEYSKKFGSEAPPLSMLGADAYSGVNFLASLVNKAGSTKAKDLMKTSEGVKYETATDNNSRMSNRHVVKNMYLAECEGVTFNVVKTFSRVFHGESCSV